MDEDEVLYCRITQIGLLRLLTTRAVMGSDCLTTGRAWDVYAQWLGDPKVRLGREPAEAEEWFRQASKPFWRQSSPKALGDCYLVALGRALHAKVVTLDRGLSALAHRVGQDAVWLR